MKFCKVADIADWQNEDFQRVSSLLNLTHRSRKSWEYIQVYCGLKELGFLNSESKAIGLGVGHEPLIYAFTNVCQSVVATDLYESENWGAASLKTEEVYHYNSFPYQPDRLSVKHMSMTAIDFPDESFDFVWSCCAIEHVNSFRDLHRVYEGIHRILKPGGIAAITTEYNSTDLHSYEPNMLFTDRYWIEHWLTGENPLVQGFELVDAVNLSITDHPENEPIPRSKLLPSIQVISRDITLNSAAFFLRKTGEFSHAYDDRWLPEPLRLYHRACDANLDKNYEQSVLLLQPLLSDETISSRLRFAALRRLAIALDAQEKTTELSEICQKAFLNSEAIEDSDHLLPVAQFCRKVGLWEEANRLYQRIETLPGSHFDQISYSLIGQAQYYAQQNDFESALSRMNQAVSNLPESGTKGRSKVYFHQGLYLEKLGRYEEAIAAYQSALLTAKPNSKLYQNCQTHLLDCQRKQQGVSTTVFQKVKTKLSAFKSWMPLIR